MKKIFFLPVIFLSAFAVLCYKSLSHDDEIPSALVKFPLPQLKIKSLVDNNEYELSQDFFVKDKWSLINVWASWCDNCLADHVFLTELSKDYEIFGINYKDNATNALSWLNEWGNPYHLVAYDNSGKLSFELGVYGVPETFLVDGNGVIRYRYAGALTNDIWKRKFLPVIKKVEKLA